MFLKKMNSSHRTEVTAILKGNFNSINKRTQAIHKGETHSKAKIDVI